MYIFKLAFINIKLKDLAEQLSVSEELYVGGETKIAGMKN